MRILPCGISGTWATPSWSVRISNVACFFTTLMALPSTNRTTTLARSTGLPSMFFTSTVSRVMGVPAHAVMAVSTNIAITQSLALRMLRLCQILARAGGNPQQPKQCQRHQCACHQIGGPRPERIEKRRVAGLGAQKHVVGVEDGVKHAHHSR